MTSPNHIDIPLKAALRIAREHALLIESIEATLGAFAVYDADDRLIACNDSYRVIHEQGFAALASAGPVTYSDLVRATIRGGIPDAEVEAAVAERLATHRAADGMPRDRFYPGKGWFRVVKTRTPGGAVAGFATDITALKDTEAELRAARQKLEDAFQARGRFVATLCHELRNPLNAMLGLAARLVEDVDEPSQDMVAALRHAGKEMVGILDDVLDHASLDRGSIKAVPEPFDLTGLCDELSALYAQWAQGIGLAFVSDLGGITVPRIVAPRRLIYQIVGNLLANAVKFTTEGEVALRVATLTAPDGGLMLEITVEDSGAGMTDEQVSGLFKEYAQLEAGASASVRGSGLGLSIARSCAEAMRGNLSVASEPGRGSAFTLIMPVEPALPAAVSETGAAREVLALPPPGGAPIEVLAAEDNEVNRIVLKGMLAKLPVELTIVENGALAVEAAARRRFDLILMDSQMPVMDGLAAVRLIRAQEAVSGAAPVRIISVSANAMPEFIDECAEAGVDQCISKPVDIVALQRAVLESRKEAE